MYTCTESPWRNVVNDQKLRNNLYELIQVISNYCYQNSDSVIFLNIRLVVLQSASMAFEEVNEDAVYTCVGHPLRKDIHNIVHWMLNDRFNAAINSILYTVANMGTLNWYQYFDHYVNVLDS